MTDVNHKNCRRKITHHTRGIKNQSTNQSDILSPLISTVTKITALSAMCRDNKRIIWVFSSKVIQSKLVV